MFFRRRHSEIEGDSLAELLESAGLADRYEALAEEERAAVWLRTEPVDDAAVPIGDSKLGGHPDLPEEADWPEHEGRPMTFVAQVRLVDLAGLPDTDAFPASGHLAFFVDERDPEMPACAVLYCEGFDLRRVPAPGNARVLPSCRVLPAAKSTIPDVMSFEVEELVLSNVETDDYIEMSRVYAARFPGPEHQMLGHPVLVQGEMRIALAVAAIPEEEEAPDEVTPEVLAEAARWTLLLQLDSDRDAGMNWGDGGVLYFWAHEDDLAEGDFSAVQALIQSNPE